MALAGLLTTIDIGAGYRWNRWELRLDVAGAGSSLATPRDAGDALFTEVADGSAELRRRCSAAKQIT